MQDAFADLSALMTKAQDMVRLANDLNEQLTIANSRNPEGQSIEPEEATFVRSSLAQLGLSMKNAPVTADMSRDERKYMEQLAKELGSVLLGDRTENDGIMKSRGIIGLDEVWGGWNRARGVCKSFFDNSTYFVANVHRSLGVPRPDVASADIFTALHGSTHHLTNVDIRVASFAYAAIPTFRVRFPGFRAALREWTAFDDGRCSQGVSECRPRDRVNARG